MKPFRYITPRNLGEALQVLQTAGEGTAIIAGGTDLVPRMRSGEATPRTVVDLRHLPLREIVKHKDRLELGACITLSEIRESKLIARHLPALREASMQMAGPPVRNRGTLGGNLVTASPAADTVPPLLAYDASVLLRRADDDRTVPLDQFFVGPGETALRAGELLTTVVVPFPPDHTACKFIKLGRRRAMAISVVSVAARLTLGKKGKVDAARIALGSVAPTPVRAQEAEKRLLGQSISEKLIAEAGRVASEECSPISDIRASSEYRRKMVDVLVRRALQEVWRELVGESSHG